MSFLSKLGFRVFMLSAVSLSALNVYAAEDLNFRSDKSWKSGRWFLIANWDGRGALQWLGGGKSSLRNVASACFSETPKIRRPEATTAVDANGHPLEVLSTAGQWFAIEVSPDREQEALEVALGSDSSCRAEIRFKAAFGAEGGGPKPLVFLRPDSNVYFGHNISFSAPSSERADIQLDLLMGYWKATLPNAETGYSQNISFVPNAIARGEWLLPFWRRIGLTLELEQSVANFGGTGTQNVLFSDWAAGAFVQFFIPVLEGIQVRGTVKYHQHLADDGQEIQSVAPPNTDARYLQLGTTANFYVWKRWLLGADFEYGLPGRLAGQGVNQSYWSFLGRTGVRLTDSMTILMEGGLRSYNTEGYDPEKVLQFQTGIRLDL